MQISYISPVSTSASVLSDNLWTGKKLFLFIYFLKGKPHEKYLRNIYFEKYKRLLNSNRNIP